MEAGQRLISILRNLSDPNILLKIRDRLKISIMMNFRLEGRPQKWKPSQRSLGLTRSKKDGKFRKGKTLQDTGMLKNSIQAKISDGNVVIGSPMKYAETMQNRSPFLMVQNSDIEYIRNLIIKEFAK